MGVLDKSMAVLDAVAAGGPASLAELVDATGLSRATVHRLAVALEAHGLLRRDPAGRFALGLRLVGLGREAAEAWPLGERAAPVLAGLRDDTGESVQLYVRDGDARLCVASLESPHELRTMVGPRRPAPAGPGGRRARCCGARCRPASAGSRASRSGRPASPRSAPVPGSVASWSRQRVRPDRAHHPRRRPSATADLVGRGRPSSPSCTAA